MGFSSIPPPPSQSWGCSTGLVLNRVRYCTQSSSQWGGSGGHEDTWARHKEEKGQSTEELASQYRPASISPCKVSYKMADLRFVLPPQLFETS